MPQEEPFLDYKDPEWVAEKLGLEKNTVYKFLKDGRLPGLQIGRKWLISERELANFLEAETASQTAGRRDGVEGWLNKVRAHSKNFTGNAIQALVKAREFAIDFGHSYVGQEHILLSVLYSPKSVAFKLFAELGLDPNVMRDELIEQMDRDLEMRTKTLDLTKNASLALKQASSEAKDLGHTWVGAEHIILGMLSAKQGFGYEFLKNQGLTKVNYMK